MPLEVHQSCIEYTKVTKESVLNDTKEKSREDHIGFDNTSSFFDGISYDNMGTSGSVSTVLLRRRLLDSTKFHSKPVSEI